MTGIRVAHTADHRVGLGVGVGDLVGDQEHVDADRRSRAMLGDVSDRVTQNGGIA